VDDETVKRFSAVALAEGKTPSELLRQLINDKLNSTAKNLDKLQAALMREHEARMAALLDSAHLPSEEGIEDASPRSFKL
jgi:hypothetical protein